MKKKYLMCQILIKILKQQAIPNSSLHNFKTYSSKGCRKTSQRCRWIKLPSQHSNYKYSNFQQKISLQIIGFSFDWWIYFLLALTSIFPVRYKVNDAKTFKSPVYYFTLCLLKSSCISGIILYLLGPFHLKRVNKLYRKYKPVRITQQKEHLLIWNYSKPKHLSS